MTGDDDELWRHSGLHRFQVVRCVVTGHRDSFGVEVSIISPVANVDAFIDFVLLTDDDDHLPRSRYPPIGDVLDAVTIDFMPDGELRLSARPSSLTRHRVADP
jgi:hypothetical protein